MPLTDPDGVERALDTAYRLFRDRDAWLPLRRRIEILDVTADKMEREAEELALQAAREGGKPLAELCAFEAARAIDAACTCCELLRSEAGHVIPMNVNAASASRIAFTQARAGRRRCCDQRLQSPTEPDRAPGRAGDRRRLPSYRQAGSSRRRSPASISSPCCKRRAFPDPWCQAVALDSNELGGRARRRRTRRLPELHRQRPGRLEPALPARARRPAAPSSTAARRQ